MQFLLRSDHVQLRRSRRQIELTKVSLSLVRIRTLEVAYMKGALGGIFFVIASIPLRVMGSS